MRCPSCQAEAPGLVCEACGKVLPPRRLDPFAALGLPARFVLDEATIDGRVRELSRKLHPDKFVRAPQADKMASLQATTTLNDSARILRDPLARAAALLVTRGVTIGENEAVAGDLLGEILELREAAEDARGDAVETAKVNTDVRQRLDATMAELASALDTSRDDARAKQAVIAARYYDRMLQAAPVSLERSL